MSKEEKTIKDLLTRVKKLEKTVFAENKAKPKLDNKQIFVGATGGLRLLISKGFFDKKRSFGEIKKALADRDYHYSNQAIQTPLNKLSRIGGLLVGLKESGKKAYAKRK